MKLLTIDKSLVWMAPCNKSQSAKYVAVAIIKHIQKFDSGEKLN